MKYLPLFIDFSGRKVVIFGGGAVGERKARFFSEAAEVVVISPEFTPGLEAMPGITRISKAVWPEDAKDLIVNASLVVAATGDTVLNEAIRRTAQESGTLVNAVDGDTDVILPAVLHRGDITVAITTGGKSPAMSKYLRQRLEASLGPEMEAMVRLQSELRDILKLRMEDQKDREHVLWQVLKDPKIWEMLQTSYDDALAMALVRLP